MASPNRRTWSAALFAPAFARPQHRRQRLSGLVQPDRQRVEPEPPLVGRRRVLLLGMSGDQGGVEVEGDRGRPPGGGPDPLTGHSSRRGDAPQFRGGDRFDRPPGRGL